VILGLLADVVLLGHVAFVLFVGLGGLLVVRSPRWAWLHLPCAAWGAWVEIAGWVCPLTPLEVSLRRQAGESGYAGGFLEHYVVPVLYPAGLTREIQIGLGVAVLLLNAGLYAWAARRHRRAD
jgi:hypothetical protein